MRRPPIATLLLAACVGSPGPSGRTAVPPAPPALVRYAPATVQYRAVEHRHVEQVFQGQPLSSEVHTTLALSTTVTAGTDALSVIIVLDSARVDGAAGFPAATTDAARGARFTAVLEPTGVMRGFGGGDDRNALLQQRAVSLRDFYPRLPAGGARPGARWTDTTETVAVVHGVELRIVSRNDRGVVAWGTYGGWEALEVTTLSSYQLSGIGRQSGQELTMQGTGRRYMRQYLSGDGRYLGCVGADTAAIEIRLTASGIVIPVNQVSTDTLVALR